MMKRPLPIGCAFLLLASAAAHAQSSVTLYGVLDDGLEYRNNLVGGSALQQSAGNLSGSRWGLRIKEDLGGGLSAIGTLESGFSLSDGTTSLSTTSLGTPATTTQREFSRQAFVGLTYKNQTVTLGRHQAPFFDFAVIYDPGNIATNYSILSQDVTFVTRDDNSIKYKGGFGPFTIEALYSTRYDTGYGTEVPGAELTGRDYSASLNYAQGPLSVGVVYDQRDSNTVTTSTATQKRVSAAIRYSSGPMMLFAGYRFLQADTAFLPALLYYRPPGSKAGYSSLYWAGTRYTVHNDIVLTAAAYYQNFAGTSADPWLFVTNIDYILSKRTDVYLGMAYALNKNNSNLGVSGFGTVVPGENQFGAVVGIRHTF